MPPLPRVLQQIILEYAYPLSFFAPSTHLHHAFDMKTDMSIYSLLGLRTCDDHLLIKWDEVTCYRATPSGAMFLDTFVLDGPLLSYSQNMIAGMRDLQSTESVYFHNCCSVNQAYYWCGYYVQATCKERKFWELLLSFRARKSFQIHQICIPTSLPTSSVLRNLWIYDHVIYLVTGSLLHLKLYVLPFPYVPHDIFTVSYINEVCECNFHRGQEQFLDKYWSDNVGIEPLHPKCLPIGSYDVNHVLVCMKNKQLALFDRFTHALQRLNVPRIYSKNTSVAIGSSYLMLTPKTSMEDKRIRVHIYRLVRGTHKEEKKRNTQCGHSVVGSQMLIQSIQSVVNTIPLLTQ